MAHNFIQSLITLHWKLKTYSNINYIFQGGPEIGGIFVRNLLPGGAAEQSRSVHVGMSAILL